MKDLFKLIVSCVILNDKGQVLLGKRSLSEDVFPGLWGIPGGKIEADQTGKDIVEETLKREAKEEMGIEIEVGEYLESSCRISEDSGKIYLIFSAKHLSGEPQALEDTDEVKWWSVKDLNPEQLTPHTYENILLSLSRQKFR